MIHNLVEDKGCLQNWLPGITSRLWRRIYVGIDYHCEIDDMDYSEMKVGMCLPITLNMGDTRELHQLLRRLGGFP